MYQTPFTRLTRQYQNDPEYQLDSLIFDFNEEICRLMEEKGVSRAELARRIGVNRSYITRILNENANLTVETMVKIVTALGMKIDLITVPIDERSGYTPIEVNDNLSSLRIKPSNFVRSELTIVPTIDPFHEEEKLLERKYYADLSLKTGGSKQIA